MTPITRETIDYDTWYSPWMKLLAKSSTLAELQARLGRNRGRVHKESMAHLRAVQATTSMSSQSQRRAQTGNVVRATGDEAIAIRGALEIYQIFPEHTKEGVPLQPTLLGDL